MAESVLDLPGLAEAPLQRPRLHLADAPRFYRPELDTLRFFAFLLVFTGHTLSPAGHGKLVAALRNTGGFGVPIFFLLSAYLITELLLRERVKTGSISLHRFYMRRILRIWPLYFGFLTVAWLFSHFAYPQTRMDAAALLGALLLAGNWCLAHGLHLGVASPLWSISVEEQFYLLWPCLLGALTRKRALIAGGLIWIAAQAGTIAMVHHGVSSYNVLWFSSIPHFQYFGLGILLCAYRPRPLSLLTRTALALGGLLILYADAYFAHPYFLFSIAGVGAGMIFLAALGLPMAASGLLQKLGRISYGLYVFHMLMVFLANLAARRIPLFGGWFERHPAVFVHTLALPATIVVAVLSYRYFELPFLRLKERFEVIRSRPA